MLLIILTLLALTSSGIGADQVAAGGSTALPPLELSQLIEIAIEESPELSAVDFRLAAARARIPQAGALPDPMFSVNLSNVPVNTFAFDKAAMSGIQLMWRQTFPYAGKRALRKEIERHSAEMIESQWGETRNRLVSDVKKAYFELAYLHKANEITEENKRLLEDFADIARTKYEVGRGIQADVLRVEVELSKITDRLLTLEQSEQVQRANLNSLLNRPPQAPLGDPQEMRRYEFALTLEAAQGAAKQSRPALTAMQSMIEKAGAAVGLAKRDTKPDFSVDLGYRIRSNSLMERAGGRDWYSIGVSASLPIYAKDKQRKKIEEQEAERDALHADLEAMYNAVDTAIATLFAKIGKLDQELALYETAIIPQADLALASSRAAYQVDNVDFLTMLGNQAELYKYQMAYYRSLADYAKELAELEYQMGVRLYE